ncbi:MAG: tRNA adenosine(34) deaminase TadA [Polyangia bacterium]|jgi:tRNA(adenine34) deaminase|nr:tRNA adenosine(34) deaminase TadA [Polyangia bacterium]
MSGDLAPRTDEAFMERCLELASRAAAAGEVPVGALVVHGGQIIGEGWNRREAERDPTAHAEILALREAGVRRGTWRLDGSTLYVTLEPCPMCAGALVNARVARLVFGCADPKAGAVRTLYRIGDDPRLNHRVEILAGVGAEGSAELLERFFASLRKKQAP